MKTVDISALEYNEYYKTYINKVGDLSLLEGLSEGLVDALRFFNSLPEDKMMYAYAEGKWTIKEVIQHMIDTERVFAYRALRFSRNDKTELPGFDENAYTLSSVANRRTKEALIEEFTHVRESTISLFKSFTNQMLLQSGKASGGDMSVRAIGFIVIGHVKHHSQVVEERYL
ncbi:DinB family protein [Lacinutrix sp. C3R15]|uniref:DinB family protein n=1 Tax=Flavobacteriaceae TaxID=49546 RepID=UPI001C091195|nr:MULTISPECIES: DinB family protein [Flavobacteriaceae]MBU2938639.1 DinB family protein [Lacinutrix sp. C3R15]MDO6621953.1 DinB family protein [Oceanihabitans sp. 1_MG-2023]